MVPPSQATHGLLQEYESIFVKPNDKKQLLISVCQSKRRKCLALLFTSSTSDGCVLPEALENDVSNMINEFIRYRTELRLHPHDRILVITGNFASIPNFVIASDIYQYNYQYYQAPEQLKNMENDFKIKHVAPFMNAAFDVNGGLAAYWDTPLNLYRNSNMKIQRRQTTDAKFATIGGIENGVMEIKPFKTPFEMLEEDRVRLADISKRDASQKDIGYKEQKRIEHICYHNFRWILSLFIVQLSPDLGFIDIVP
ncbi:hypothetical protein EDC96DRAFT_567863 [Choanephora cucurbitarum]|nr:hypothetical protein EDC96DRAFT_567863 [Choanephora cucurbitarum]